MTASPRRSKSPETLKISQESQQTDTDRYLEKEYAKWEQFWDAQPPIIQRFVEAQSYQLADALSRKYSQVKFSIPDQVISLDGVSIQIPNDQRDQTAGGVIRQFTRSNLAAAIRTRLDELEASQHPGVSYGAGLLRFSIAGHLVRDILPEGRSVTYQPLEDEEIPTIPVAREGEAASALTEATDAIVEETSERRKERGELLVPYVPAARRFYLPQWVAFDEHDHLLVNSVQEAEAFLKSMQEFLSILHMAVSFAPYMIVDSVYHQKRYGILGQLVNQGRALARYETQDVIGIIKKRSASNDLNRGLSLSLPYFDDQDLEMKTHDFEVIPAGRIMFVPAFVVRAAHLEQAKTAQDTRLSQSTRNHLLSLLRMLEDAFDTTLN